MAGFIVLLSYDLRPETVWTHPTLSKAEQNRVLANCQIRAYEAVGGGVKRSTSRIYYVRACLTTKGFVSKELYESERTPDSGFAY